MNCTALARQFAFDCTPLTGLHGESVFELGTPFSFDDGTAICLYVINRAPLVEINDEALALHHLSGMGLDPWNPRRMTALRERIHPFGVTLCNNGALSLLAQETQLGWHVPRFISAELAVAQWAREQMGGTEESRNLAEEVEMYLRAWRPHADLTRHPRQRGISGHEHQFDFLQNDELIDVITPHHNATGGLMRKLVDVLNAGDESAPKVRVIVDDRTDPARAGVEMQIIASLAKAMPLSKLLERVHFGSA